MVKYFLTQIPKDEDTRQLHITFGNSYKWNGAKLTDAETMLEWAKTMTWKGIPPLISLTQKIYEKGIKLTKKAMKEIEAKLERNPLLPKWDILIQPT